jgi:hypothetical protein
MFRPEPTERNLRSIWSGRNLGSYVGNLWLLRNVVRPVRRCAVDPPHQGPDRSDAESREGWTPRLRRCSSSFPVVSTERAARGVLNLLPATINEDRIGWDVANGLDEFSPGLVDPFGAARPFPVCPFLNDPVTVGVARARVVRDDPDSVERNELSRSGSHLLS